MSNIVKYIPEDGKLPTSVGRVPALRLDAGVTQPSELSAYHKRFVIQWYLTYERLSVPPDRRMEMTNTVAEKELVIYANRIIDKYPGIGQDVIWEAWTMGVERYFLDNGQRAYPLFNYATLIFWLDKYRNDAQRKLYPPQPQEAPPQLQAPKKTPAELLKGIRKMDASQVKLVMLFAGPYQSLFDHIRDKMKASDPNAYRELQGRARGKWIAKVAAVMQVDPKTFDGMNIEEVRNRWKMRYGNDDSLPSPHEPYREELLFQAEAYV